MKIRLYHYIICLFTISSFMACEEKIDVKLGTSTPQLTVQGWIANHITTQTIRLTLSKDYFNNTAANGVSGATVRVSDDQGNTYNFSESTTTAGNYTSDFRGAVGLTYTLYIQYQGEEYQATSTLNRVPPIDSIMIQRGEEGRPGPSGISKGYRAELFAKDIAGTGDNYRIKTYRNGQLLNNPQDITVFQDTSVDGLTFVLPFRQSINPSSDDGKGYDLGDVIKVELLSISEAAFLFFDQLETQTTNGGLFASPIANVPTNIQNLNPASNKKAVGFFYASGVSTMEKTVQP